MTRNRRGVDRITRGKRKVRVEHGKFKVNVEVFEVELPQSGSVEI